jgi:hypothetical protein
MSLLHGALVSAVDKDNELKSGWYVLIHDESSCYWVEWFMKEELEKKLSLYVDVDGPYSNKLEAVAELQRILESRK